jgi:hypothetical protein
VIIADSQANSNAISASALLIAHTIAENQIMKNILESAINCKLQKIKTKICLHFQIKKLMCLCIKIKKHQLL